MMSSVGIVPQNEKAAPSQKTANSRVMQQITHKERIANCQFSRALKRQIIATHEKQTLLSTRERLEDYQNQFESGYLLKLQEMS